MSSILLKLRAFVVLMRVDWEYVTHGNESTIFILVTQFSF